MTTLPNEIGLPLSAEIAEAEAAEIQPQLLCAWARLLKRVLDIVLGGFLLLISLPVAAVIALAILLEDGPPVFFAHTRLGVGGRKFRLWKFRSMVRDAQEVLDKYLREKPELAVEWAKYRKLKDDPRVTRVGRLLRKRSLDEIPQLWNVLRGDMSLVGPRPIVEEEIPRYGPAYELYTKVRPGLTGLWQVSGRNDTGYKRRVDLDCRYIREWSLAMEIGILLRTVKVVLSGHGAY